MTSRDTRAATHEARLYAHFLDDGEGGPEREGGADRGLTLAERIQRRVPNVGLIARNQRLFVLRAVRTVAEHYGIRQFLDIGSGPDHAPNVHEVAQAIDPVSRVVYVDRDEAAMASLSARWEGDDRVGCLTADVREPESILRSPVVRGTIDFDQPVALLLASVFLFVEDEDDPAGIIERLVEELPCGSHVVFSQGTYDYDGDRRTVELLTSLYAEGGMAVTPRGKATIAGFLEGAGLEILPPGIVPTNRWRPETEARATPDALPGDEADSCIHAVLARKP
ncbi:SAM-dependent methyltransferase [Streptomyces cuspidosporus]|uniref:SAM-dependent methyltransferase n=1 Tax=Streptomyces cuspidosporus TaxID=66882 RepID=A0ABP5TY94_9ACTN